MRLFGTVALFVALPALAWGQAVLPNVNIIGSSPLLGTGIDRNLVPAETNVLTQQDISRTGAPSALGALSDQVSGVALDSASGNPYQPSLFYHGFAASPLQGTAQGLAVYVNGVRFNAAFGDTVNWDLIPDIAIDRMNLEGSNPVFGLNALGGSLNVQLKNGFTYHGGELVLSGGSFGQAQSQFQYGKQVGDVAVYMAGTGLHAGGWRDNQSSDIYNFYGDLGWRGDKAELHLSVTAASTALDGPGPAPVELIDASPQSVFTAPNAIANKYIQLALSGSYDVSDTTSLQVQAYFNNFQQFIRNGNTANDAPCASGAAFLCQNGGAGGVSTTRGGVPVPDFLNGGPYSQLDAQTTNTNGYGASAQATNSDDVFGLHNRVVAGMSFDGAQSEFDGSTAIGGLTPLTRSYIGPGVTLFEPGTNTPARVAVSNAYYGLFVSDTLEITDRLAVTGSGRFNAAAINLSDQGGGTLTGNHSYGRFNPALGFTYRLAPWLTAYGGYSEANRAPTPVELSCAGPADSCSLANFFVGDPNLKQVVAHTMEAGLRGSTALSETGKLTYTLGVFHTDLADDIIFINSATLGRAYFSNIGATRRQGVDAGLQYQTPRWLAYANYTYTDATFQSGFTEGAGRNPQADANGTIQVRAGNRLPGIPAQQMKLGVQYKVTEDWTVGGTAAAVSGEYLFGDEANLNAKLPAYVTVNFNTSYQVTPHIQIFGLIENLTNQKYFTYGTFAPTAAVTIAQAPGATNPRSYSIAAPIGGFGGVRMIF